MSHITAQYGPYYCPIWGILLTNMGHIISPLPVPNQGRGAEKESNRIVYLPTFMARCRKETYCRLTKG